MLDIRQNSSFCFVVKCFVEHGSLTLCYLGGSVDDRVVSASDSQSGGPGFEPRSGHLLDLCSVVISSNSRSCL